MIQSKAWNWKIINEDQKEQWKNPCIESYYLLNRWKGQNKNLFLDLGCGIGRHSIMFAENDFDTYAFDLSSDAVEKTKEWAEEKGLKLHYNTGDMLNLPYEDNKFDCIICRNVISHTDTEGIKKIISEIKRVLSKDGECYLTLGSKNSCRFKADSPIVDENTKILNEEGPENGIPHFFADYDLILKLFSDFKIEWINHVEDFFEDNGETKSSFHYHILVRKTK